MSPCLTGDLLATYVHAVEGADFRAERQTHNPKLQRLQLTAPPQNQAPQYNTFKGFRLTCVREYAGRRTDPRAIHVGPFHPLI